MLPALHHLDVGVTSKPKEMSLSFSHRRLAIIKTQWKEKTWHLVSDGATGAKQEHNVAADRGSYRTSQGNGEKEWTQLKILPHVQELCTYRGPLGCIGSWGNALWPRSHPSGKLCLQNSKAEGTASKDPKAAIFKCSGDLYVFLWPASPFLPLLSQPTITTSLFLYLLDLLFLLYCPPPCYSFFHLPLKLFHPL